MASAESRRDCCLEYKTTIAALPYSVVVSYRNQHDILDESTQEQLSDLYRLRKAHERRLSELEIGAAITGRATDAAIKIEIGDIKTQIAGIDKTIARLNHREVEFLTRLLPSRVEGERLPENDIDDRLDSIARYTINVETSMHKEFGALFLLLDTENENERNERKARQKETDKRTAIIIGLLVLIVLALLLT